MDLGFGLEQAQKQIQTLSQQQIQSMEILRMGSMELLERIREELEENPVLEAEEFETGTRESDLLILRQLEWLREHDRQNHYYNINDREDGLDPLATVGGVDRVSLYDHIASQIFALGLPGELRSAALAVAESLDTDGGCDGTPELAAELFISEELCEEAVRVIQGLDPAGIGARSLSERIILQLRALEEDTALAERIAEGYLDELSKNRCDLIAKALGEGIEEVRAAADRIRSLDPRPAAEFDDTGETRYISPDIVVVDGPDGQLAAVINDGWMPKLSLSSYYSGLSKGDDQGAKQYLAERLRQARWFIGSVENRRKTLLDCANAILALQRGFFEGGTDALNAMSLADVAELAGVHESTVSRAVRDKYIQCKKGVIPVRSLFARRLGADASADGAKRAIEELISSEDKKKPLSDQKLSELLERRGISVSRRTVAKYRSELGIEGTDRRRDR